MTSDVSPYKEWISLYSEEIGQTYKSERKEIRPILMTYSILFKEIERVKNELSKEVDSIKDVLNRNDNMLKEANKPNLHLVIDKKAVEEKADLATKSKDAANKENDTLLATVTIRDIDMSSGATTPDSILGTNNIEENFKSPEQNGLRQTQLSPKINKSRLVRKNKFLRAPSPLYPEIDHRIEKSIRLSKSSNNKKKTALFCKSPDVIDCSVIDLTSSNNDNNKAINGKRLSKRPTRKKLEQSTLTQIFWDQYFDDPKKQSTPKRKLELNGLTSDIHSNNINGNGAQNHPIEDETLDDIEIDFQPKENSSTNKVSKLNIPQSSTNKTPSKNKDNVDVFEIVRGKKRKNLPGWTCKDCEKFYKGMDLSEEELQKRLNECSKHRYAKGPRVDTLPGFWDLTFPSTPPLPEKSREIERMESLDDSDFNFMKK